MLWLSIGLALLMLVNIYLVSLLLQKNKQLQEENLINVERAQKGNHAVLHALMGIGKQLTKVERQFDGLALQTSEIAHIAQTEPQETAYQMARQLMSRGAGLEEIISSCGLSRAEAELLAQLQGGMDDDIETISTESYQRR